MDQDAGVSVVGMVVVGARRNDDVRVPFADLPDQLKPDIQAGHQLPVMVVEDQVFDAEPAAGLAGLLTPPRGQHSSALGLVAGVSVRH